MSAFHPTVGQTRLHCTLARGKNVRSRPWRQRGAQMSALHLNLGQTRQQHTPAWGINIAIAPQRGAKMSTLHPSIAQIRPQHVSVPVWGVHVNSTP